jgi:hypothetical protein
MMQQVVLQSRLTHKRRRFTTAASQRKQDTQDVAAQLCQLLYGTESLARLAECSFSHGESASQARSWPKRLCGGGSSARSELKRRLLATAPSADDSVHLFHDLPALRRMTITVVVDATGGPALQDIHFICLHAGRHGIPPISLVRESLEAASRA